MWSFKNILKISSTWVYFLTEHKVALACFTFAYAMGPSSEQYSSNDLHKKRYFLFIVNSIFNELKEQKKYELLMYFFSKMCCFI